ncbi:hypothetical protein [uncultured Eubacterium sp.]|uniref:hypothetical protein n=1 Tax=uncultured Eubacterium sp. TaxID=165185 RepID=UPI0025935CDC|nr:hypothetical protein [uncultured Eubacterium sp.]
MEWNVFFNDSNKNKIVKWNVFEHHKFSEEVKEIKNRNISKEEFNKIMQRIVLYYFWSKSEYEIILSPWVGRAENIKVDIYKQLHLNWDKFVDYIYINFKEEI